MFIIDFVIDHSLDFRLQLIIIFGFWFDLIIKLIKLFIQLTNLIALIIFNNISISSLSFHLFFFITSSLYPIKQFLFIDSNLLLVFVISLNLCLQFLLSYNYLSLLVFNNILNIWLKLLKHLFFFLLKVILNIFNVLLLIGNRCFVIFFIFLNYSFVFFYLVMQVWDFWFVLSC